MQEQYINELIHSPLPNIESKEKINIILVLKDLCMYAVNQDKIKHCCEFVLDDKSHVNNGGIYLLIDEFKKIIFKLFDYIEVENIVKKGAFCFEENEMFFMANRFLNFMSEYFREEKKYIGEIKQKKDLAKIKYSENKNHMDNLKIFIPNIEFQNIPGCCLEIATRAWQFIVKTKWERKLKNKPAIAYPVSECIFEACWNPKNKIHEIDNKKLILNYSKTIIANIIETVELSLDEIKKRHNLLNTILGHKIIRFVIMEYHKRFFDISDHKPGKIEIEGGREKLAELLNIKSGKDISNIYEILNAGQEFSMYTHSINIGGLWTFSEIKGIGRTKPHITIIPGDALTPHYLYKFPKNNQILLPITPLPALVEPKNCHAQQVVAQFLVIQHIVNNRKFLRNHGGGFFDDVVLEGIAEKAGLPMSVMKRVWEKWQHDSESSEAFLTKMEKNIYHIAMNKTFYEARGCIEQLTRLSKLAAQRVSKKVRNI